MWLALHIDYHHIYLDLNVQTLEIINDINHEILSLDLCKKSNFKLEFDPFFV